MRRKKQTISDEEFLKQTYTDITERLQKRINTYLEHGADDIAFVEYYLSIKFLDIISFENSRTDLSNRYSSACRRLDINGSELAHEITAVKNAKKDVELAISNKIEELRNKTKQNSISNSELVNIYNNESIDTKTLVEIQNIVKREFGDYYEVSQIPADVVENKYKNELGNSKYKTEIDSLFIIANKIKGENNFGYYIGLDKRHNLYYDYPIGSMEINKKFNRLGWVEIYANVNSYRDLKSALTNVLSNLNRMRIVVEGTK